MLRGRSRPLRSRGGFTLLEMMVSIAVLLVAVMGAMSSQLSSMNLLRTSQETNTAMSDLHVALEELLATPQTGDIPVQFPAGVPIAAYANLNLGAESIVPAYPSGTAADPLEVVLVMTWNDWRGRARQARLATMVAQ